MIKSYSRQQRVVALSSAEAELYAMVAASAESLAIIAYCRDLGVHVGGEVYTDSAAALGITHRAGIGKVRHLRTQGLWVQEVRVGGRLSYKKVLGTKNPSDVLTKHVPGELLERHIESIGSEARHGRAQAAPELNSVESLVVVMDPDWEDVTEGIQEIGELETRRLATAGADEEARRVSWASTVSYRAIPATGKGRTVTRRSRAALQGRGASGRYELQNVIAADGPAPGGAAQHGDPGGVRHGSWADLTDREYGP